MPTDRLDQPRGPLAALPDGGWQYGVGPGAVLIGPDHDPTLAAAGQALGRFLAGLPDTSTAATPAAAPRCPVTGTGPLAVRLRRALGDVSADDEAPLHVLVHQHVVPPEEAIAAARSRRTVLPVVVQPRRVVVGPATAVEGGPCLHCLDLHRRDRDRAWPSVATALGHPAEQLSRAAMPVPLQTATEGLVLLLASSLLGGRPVSPGLSYELGVEAPNVVVRRWARHTTCTWHG